MAVTLTLVGKGQRSRFMVDKSRLPRNTRGLVPEEEGARCNQCTSRISIAAHVVCMTFGNSDRIPLMSTVPEQNTDDDEADVGPLRARIIRARRNALSATVESHPAQNDARTSAAQQTKKTAPSELIPVKESPVVTGAENVQGNQAGEATPERNLVDEFLNNERIRRDKIQRLMDIHEQIEPKPYRDAHSMKRQG